MIAAAEKGRNRERYILGNELSTSTTEVIKLAQSLFPNIKKPPKLSKNILLMIAFLEEISCKITGKAPALLRSQVKAAYVEQKLNISKARRELGDNPRAPEEAIKEVLIYLKNRGDSY
ncbi:MAG: hypothetical protein ACE5K0_04330 [Candidatus Methanofastidiosia archaeon]